MTYVIAIDAIKKGPVTVVNHSLILDNVVMPP